MAGIQINALPAVPSAQLTDVFPVDQGATTYKETNAQLLSLFESNIVITPSNFSGILPVPNGGTGNSTFTAYSVICAGTTATGAFQNVSGLGTSGQQLTSNGPGALPTWQAASSSGTVNLGTANEIAYYATTGTAVSGLTGANRSLLVTNNTGVPSMLASASATGQILQGSTTGIPTWSTPTYPSASGTAGFILRSDGTNNIYSQSTFADLYAASSLLYANGANNVAGLATTNRASLSTNSTGIPTWLALTDGQFVVGSTAGSPAATTITAGAGISVINASNSITIAATGGGFAWTSVAGTTQAAAVENGYILANAAQTTVTLPAVYAIGDTIIVIGSTANTGGWIVTASAGDTVRVNNSTTSAGGTVTSSAVAGQTIELVCDVANTSWVMASTSSVILTTA